MAWLKDMGEIYEEGYPSTTNRAPNSRGVMPPQETMRGLAYKGIFGEPESSVLNSAMGMGAIHPVPEQEEEPTNNSRVLNLIDSELGLLDNGSMMDRPIILVLSRLKEKISKLA